MQARDYIRDTLSSYGYDVSVQDFAFDASAYLPARVDFAPAADRGERHIGAGDRAARLGRRIGERPADSGRDRTSGGVPAGGLAGGVALIERGDLTFSQKVENAIAAGASGVVIYNNEEGRGVFDLGDAVAIPVVSIDQSAGQDLVAKIAAQPFGARVTVSPPSGTAYNVVAKPKGVASCDTVTGGHYDSVPVTGGADDNASGTASVLEVARVLAAKKSTARHCFVLFSAEEFGLFGSKAYVESLTPDELNGLRGMVNLDVVGNANSLELLGDDDLIDVARLAAERLGVDATSAVLPPNSGSDHLSFQRAGVHVVMFYREDNLIHTPQDAIDRIVPASLAETVTVAVATLEALARRSGERVLARGRARSAEATVGPALPDTQPRAAAHSRLQRIARHAGSDTIRAVPPLPLEARLRLHRVRQIIVPCVLLAVAGSGCFGGGSSNGKAPDSSKIPTATLPATLPEPKILSNSVVQSGGGSSYTIKDGDTLARHRSRLGIDARRSASRRTRGWIRGRCASGSRSSCRRARSRRPRRPYRHRRRRARRAARRRGPRPKRRRPQRRNRRPPRRRPTTEPAPQDTPAPDATATPSSVGQTYTVEEGDFPATIAEKFGITLEALLAANPGINPTDMHIGDVIIIPPKRAGSAS